MTAEGWAQPLDYGLGAVPLVFMKAIETQYKGYRFRSRLEARWAVFFDALKLRWVYEPEGFSLPSGWYLPDFYIEDWESWVEIKPRRIEDHKYHKDMVVWQRQYNGHRSVKNQLPSPDEPPHMFEACKLLEELGTFTQKGEILILGQPWPGEHSITMYGSLWYDYFSHCRGCSGTTIVSHWDYNDVQIYEQHMVTPNPKLCTWDYDYPAGPAEAYNIARASRFEHGEKPKV